MWVSRRSPLRGRQRRTSRWIRGFDTPSEVHGGCRGPSCTLPTPRRLGAQSGSWISNHDRFGCRVAWCARSGDSGAVSVHIDDKVQHGVCRHRYPPEFSCLTSGCLCPPLCHLQQTTPPPNTTRSHHTTPPPPHTSPPPHVRLDVTTSLQRASAPAAPLFHQQLHRHHHRRLISPRPC